MARHLFALEHLYGCRDRGLVTEAVPGLLAWLRLSGRQRNPPFEFRVGHEPIAGAPAIDETIVLTWSMAALRAEHREVDAVAQRLQRGPTLHREHVTEIAGYALAMIAAAVFTPGRRIIDVMRGLAPDLLFDRTPGALRGIEAAARSSGGRAPLNAIRHGADGKQAALVVRIDVAEVHLSLWCARPRVGAHAKIKP